MNAYVLILFVIFAYGAAQSNYSNNSTPTETDRLLAQADVPSNVFFYFFRTDGTNVSISKDNSTEYLSSLFQPDTKTKFLVHGFQSSSQEYAVKGIATLYVEVQGVNVVGVDWSAFTYNPIYPYVASLVGKVGMVVAEMVDRLISSDVINIDNVHLIGHSLGAHVMGIAGLNIKSGKVPRVTGLDPAKPGFESIPLNRRLHKGDAKFVDVIHTAAGTAGFIGPIGHVDFYPNAGYLQPGCVDVSNLLEDPSGLLSCSHGRSYYYYGESIQNPKGFRAVKCMNYDDFVSGRCANNTVQYMGDATSTSARGVYYLRTNAKPPYARG